MTAMNPCPACGALLSGTAAACPKCGHTLPRRTSRTGIACSIMIVAGVSGFFAGAVLNGDMRLLLPSAILIAVGLIGFLVAG